MLDRTRSQRLMDAGFTRRPTLREFPSDAEPETDDQRDEAIAACASTLAEIAAKTDATRRALARPPVCWSDVGIALISVVAIAGFIFGVI